MVLLYCCVFFSVISAVLSSVCALWCVFPAGTSVCAVPFRVFFFFSDSLSVTSARGHVQKARTIWVYNTCGFYQKEEGMFALCFGLSYYDFYRDTVDVILFITPTVSKSAIVAVMGRYCCAVLRVSECN